MALPSESFRGDADAVGASETNAAPAAPGVEVHAKRTARTPGTARAMVTMDGATFLRDLLQGVMRLRLLGAGQEVDFLVAPSLVPQGVAEGGLQVEHLIAVAICAQAKRQAEDNVRAFFHKLRNVLRLEVLRGIEECQQAAQQGAAAAIVGYFRHSLALDC